MDIRFGDQENTEAKPNTRLYAPTKDGEKRRTQRTSAGESARTQHVEEPHVKVEKAEINPLSRFGLILSGFLLAGMILFTLSGYERIARAYADINAINAEIDTTNLRINELDVQIECAVTIQDAQQAAANANMRYPEKAQYVTIGQSWSVPESTITAGTAPADTTMGTEQDDGTGDGGVQPPAGG